MAYKLIEGFENGYTTWFVINEQLNARVATPFFYKIEQAEAWLAARNAVVAHNENHQTNMAALLADLGA